MFRFEMIVDGARFDFEGKTWDEAIEAAKEIGQSVTMLCSVDLQPQVFLAW